MKKLLNLIVIAVFCIFCLSSCSKDDKNSSLTSLDGTTWSVVTSDASATISFSTSTFTLTMTEQSVSIPVSGNYVYKNPNFSTSNISLPSITISGKVSDDGEILYLTINGDTAPLNRVK